MKSETEWHENWKNEKRYKQTKMNIDGTKK